MIFSEGATVAALQMQRKMRLQLPQELDCGSCVFGDRTRAFEA
jgi:hypothetical protein